MSTLDRADPFAHLLSHYEMVAEDWRSSPVEWVERHTGDHLWSAQRDVMRALVEHSAVAVPACHNVGKSFLAARTALWWIGTHPPGEAFVVTTAPTHRQVRNILWRELARAHRDARLPGELNQTEWWLNGEIVAFGAKPADQDPDAFQGIHATYVLVIIDEASAVPAGLWTAADTLTSNAFSKKLAIGNPDTTSSYFYQVCQPGSGWYVRHIDGLESPAFTGEKVPQAVLNRLLDKHWVEEKRLQWGEDSPLWQSKVRGQFPSQDTSGVVPWSLLHQCTQNDDPDLHDPAVSELGVDVGAGGDSTVVWHREGGKAMDKWVISDSESDQVVNKITRVINETGANKVKVDVIGVGWGVVGRLRELGKVGSHKAKVVGVNVGAKPSAKNRTRFVRLRDEVWWMARELSEAGDWDLSNVDSDTLSQLIAPDYEVAAGGKVKVESKETTQKRLGRSPDDADALLLAYYQPPKKRRAPSATTVNKE